MCIADSSSGELRLRQNICILVVNAARLSGGIFSDTDGWEKAGIRLFVREKFKTPNYLVFKSIDFQYLSKSESLKF